MSLTVPAGKATFRRLGRETATYGLGVILGVPSASSCCRCTPVFLSPSDYGIIQLLDLTVDVAAIFFYGWRLLRRAAVLFQDVGPGARAPLLSTHLLPGPDPQLARGPDLAALSPWIWKYGLKEAGQPWFIILAACNFAAGTADDMPLNFAQTHAARRLYLGSRWRSW
jgi:hypothetical protein